LAILKIVKSVVKLGEKKLFWNSVKLDLEIVFYETEFKLNWVTCIISKLTIEKYNQILI
jgi:hypothetical protein